MKIEPTKSITHSHEKIDFLNLLNNKYILFILGSKYMDYLINLKSKMFLIL